MPLRLAKIGWSKSQCKVRVGASLIIRRKHIISSNKPKSSPALKRFNYKYWDQIHAELSLFGRLEEAKDGIVAVYREHKNGNMAIAKPCPSCLNMCRSYGIKTIIYTVEGSFKEEKL